MTDITTKTITRRVIAVEEREMRVPIRHILDLLGTDAPPRDAAVDVYVDETRTTCLLFRWRAEAPVEAPQLPAPQEPVFSPAYVPMEAQEQQKPRYIAERRFYYKKMGLPRPEQTPDEVVIQWLRTGECSLGALEAELEKVGWNPTSASPVLSRLRDLGIVQQLYRSRNGRGMYKLLREPTAEDIPLIRSGRTRRELRERRAQELNGAES